MLGFKILGDYRWIIGEEMHGCPLHENQERPSKIIIQKVFFYYRMFFIYASSILHFLGKHLLSVVCKPIRPRSQEYMF